jgi:hypothetical protein
MTEPTNTRRWPYRSLSLPLIGQHQHEAERVRGERPRGPVDRRSESALQGVQCRRDDRGVDRHHQQRQRDDGEHQRTPNGTVGVAPLWWQFGARVIDRCFASGSDSERHQRKPRANIHRGAARARWLMK